MRIPDQAVHWKTAAVGGCLYRTETEAVGDNSAVNSQVQESLRQHERPERPVRLGGGGIAARYVKPGDNRHAGCRFGKTCGRAGEMAGADRTESRLGGDQPPVRRVAADRRFELSNQIGDGWARGKGSRFGCQAGRNSNQGDSILSRNRQKMKPLPHAKHVPTHGNLPRPPSCF
jgi:hypothetical protein